MGIIADRLRDDAGGGNGRVFSEDGGDQGLEAVQDLSLGFLGAQILHIPDRLVLRDVGDHTGNGGQRVRL